MKITKKPDIQIQTDTAYYLDGYCNHFSANSYR